jgi:hypothetical protein
LLNEPARVAGAIRAVVLAAGAFGFEMTGDQLASLMLALELVLMEVQRAMVVPVALLRERLLQGLPPEGVK